MSDALCGTRPARKTYRCHICGGTVAVGDRYVWQTRVEGGDIWTWTSHVLCRAAFILAWDPVWHDYDTTPEWEDAEPLVLAFFTALSGGGDDE